MQWHDHGYITFPRLLSTTEVSSLNEEMDSFWSNKSADNEVAADIYLHQPACRDEAHRLDPQSKCARLTKLRDAPEDARKFPSKVNNAYLSSSKIRGVQLHPEIVKVMRILMDAEPVVCNSLTFTYGSQQNYHFDTWYMPSTSSGKMYASWIALDDVTAENGPLSYYPGSHKIKPYVMNPNQKSNNGQLAAFGKDPHSIPEFVSHINSEIASANLKPVEFRANSGDVFIWHGQLYHAGLPIKDNMKTTRRSLVTHYMTTADHNPDDVSVMSERPDAHWINKKHQLSDL